jgi:glucose dehydrogenase
MSFVHAIRRSGGFSALSIVTAAVLSIAVGGCWKHTQQVQQLARTGGGSHPYSGALEADDGQWVRATKDYANTRYSSLDQINTTNVGSLKVAWTFNTGVARGQEAAPIVANNTMFVVAPWPNKLFALDLTKPGAPLKWSYNPNPSPAAKGEACCDWVNRGAVFADGKVFYNTLDGYTVALDASDGKLLWRTRLTDLQKGETLTMAPMVVHNNVFVGDSGGEFGVRGWLAALNAKDGKVLWQAYNTGPDKDVLIGGRFKPFYQSDKGTDLGVKTWPPEAARFGVFLPMIRQATCSTTAPRILARGTRRYGRGIISGLPASSLAMPILGRRSGSTRCPRTISTTGTASTKTSFSIFPGRAGRARC